MDYSIIFFDSLLKPHLFEDPFRDMSNNLHDPAPEPGQIHFVAAMLDGGDNALGNLIRLRSEQALFFKGGGHWSVHEAGLNRNHLDALAAEPVTKTLQEQTDHSFGRAVDVIALPSPVARNRADDDQRSPPTSTMQRRLFH